MKSHAYKQTKDNRIFNQSINQFYILLSATSSMPLALYNGTHTLVDTYTYTVKYTISKSPAKFGPQKKSRDLWTALFHAKHTGAASL